MKIKIIASQENLEKDVNKFIKDKKVIRIDIKAVPIEKMINTLSTCEKMEYYTNEYSAIISYED